MLKQILGKQLEKLLKNYQIMLKKEVQLVLKEKMVVILLFKRKQKNIDNLFVILNIFK